MGPRPAPGSQASRSQDVSETDPAAEAIKQLKEENQRLRDTALALSLTLLRHSAAQTLLDDDRRGDTDVQNLMRLADECFQCASLPGLKRPIADGLEAAGHELMAKAVEIETKIQRGKQEE
jgi:hypothetical protein